MTENKRFVLEYTGGDTFITDNITQFHHFVGFGDVGEDFNCVVDVMNKLWGQTQRFEKHDKDLMEENEQLKSEIKDLNDILARYEEKMFQ